MPGSQESIDQASPSIVCGTLTSTGTAVDNVTLPDTKGCRAVWLGAPTANTPGAQVNTSDVMFGTATCLNGWIKNDGTRDQYIQVQNPSLIHLKFITSGDKLEYRIEM